jgi:hypothetical protein
VGDLSEYIFFAGVSLFIPSDDFPTPPLPNVTTRQLIERKVFSPPKLNIKVTCFSCYFDEISRKKFSTPQNCFLSRWRGDKQLL